MSVSSPIDLEVCVDSLESAIEAVQKGASSVELCFSAHDGGYSPSIGLLKVVKDNLPLPIFVVVRPYRTDYCYSESEFEIMKEEISIAKHVGASGFVLGILTQNYQLDINRCSALISLCRPLPCTLSRAFDEIANPIQALDDAIKCGFERILVSTDRYIGSTQLISTLQEHAQNRIKIIPARNTESTTMDQLREENKRLHEELAKANSSNNHATEDSDHGGLGAFSLGSFLSHPSVLSKLQNIDVRFLLADLLRSESDRYNTTSPLDSTPASPQMASVQRLRNISPSNEGMMKSIGSPDNNGLEYVSAFNPLKPTIMVSGMVNDNASNVSSPREQPNKPTVQRRDSLQVPGSDGMGFAGSGFTRRRSLDDPTSNTIGNVQLMDTSDLLKECHNMKKERSLSAPEALYYPSIVDQVLAFKQDPRLLGGSGNAGNASSSGNNLRGMLRMNVRRGPLQKKLDALKASTHIDEEFNAVMNVNDNSNDSEPNQNLNNSLKEMDLCDYSMVNKRRRWYGPNQKKIDDSNLMHALKSGLEYSRTLKQESDFNVFKKEVETLYEGSECINERTIMCGKCGKTHHLSWLRYHQQFNTEHWIQCTGGGKTSDT
ncbi:hypothetical protein ACHWQZ_G008041 [Mnemiopsis leidyi]